MHRIKCRTTNPLEHLNREIKQGNAVATLFPNEASSLRLVNTVLMETSEDGGNLLKMESQTKSRSRIDRRMLLLSIVPG